MQAPIRKVDQETEQAAGQQGSRGCERRKGSGNDRIEPDVAAAHFFPERPGRPGGRAAAGQRGNRQDSAAEISAD